MNCTGLIYHALGGLGERVSDDSMWERVPCATLGRDKSGPYK